MSVYTLTTEGRRARFRRRPKGADMHTKNEQTRAAAHRARAIRHKRASEILASEGHYRAADLAIRQALVEQALADKLDPRRN